MKPRSRKCKIGAAGCDGTYTPFNSLQKCCSNPFCALEVGRAAIEKKARVKQRADKERIKPLTTLCSETQLVVNKVIRYRDILAGYTCISCSTGQIEDAGHFIHAGSKYRTSRLRFDHRVINGQCRSCNSYTGGGNSLAHYHGIISRYGMERIEEINELKRQADSGELEPLTKEEVREIKRTHAAEARRLRKLIDCM
jgi:predicted Zn-dependent peptidase